MTNDPGYFATLFSANNLPNLLLFAAAVGAIIVAVITLRTIVRQTKAAEDAAKAQMDADRAWVLASIAGQPEEHFAKTLVETNIPAIVWQLDVVGNTPVRIIREDYRCRIVDCDPNVVSDPMLESTPAYLSNQIPEGRVVSPPGHTQAFLVPLEADPNANTSLVNRLSQVSIGHAFFVSYGRVEYEDAFKRKGVTQFCAIYRPPRGGVITSPDGKTLNPAGFHIGGPPGYNYNT